MAHALHPNYRLVLGGDGDSVWWWVGDGDGSSDGDSARWLYGGIGGGNTW